MLDKYDADILYALQRDGRISWSKLGEKVNLSASATQRRVQALEKDGVIENFSVVVNEKKIGHPIKAMVMVNVDRQNIIDAQDFRIRIAEYPQVQAAHKISGSIDFILEVVATDIDSFGEFVEEKILSMKAVKDASSSIVLDTVKEHRSNCKLP